ncbi:hypothetical protein BC628DRAFT_1407635 [Trametes gibbosa]|uniref:RING-type E3 ubiquitin transferase n=1 Tax=Trametes gibbosa TaxID=160864 RepID=A0A6G6FQC6_9APHY|nr:hypothetical protein BC628DRAFT_1407635 [Trametes gibbosa]QIE48478.1 hypothetical protein [Trametes gibbosa]
MVNFRQCQALRVAESRAPPSRARSVLQQSQGRATLHRTQMWSSRKERSRSRDTALRHSKKAVTPEQEEQEDEPMYTGPLAHADYHRMKQELVAISKKTIHKQSKVIDELRAELTATQESHRVELEKHKRQSRKSDEVASSVESSLTCQICMELLLKPYGLSPCGHVLCLTCLLEWFKAAPPGADEMHDDDYPDAILYRKKTCPCCRTVIRTRPIPLYLVKSIASTLEKAKAPAGTVRPSPPPDDEDPWAGIFRDPTDYEGYWSTDDEDSDERDGEDVDDDEDEDDDEGSEEEDGYWSFDGYGTGEDEDGYRGPYATARWAPPTVHVSLNDYAFLDPDSEEFKMLRRGATLQMIELFRMSYTHNSGLTAVVEDDNVVYLGWNIELHPTDETGEEYMDWALVDMFDRPERWRMIHDEFDGSWVAHKLVPRSDAEEHYDDTDSEMWTAESDEDDEDI